MKIDILSKRYWYFIFSLILIVPGLVLLAVKGMPYGIDFTGGTMMELQFSQGNRPEREAFENEIINYGIDATVVLSGENNVIIRAPYLEDSEIEKLIDYVAKQYGESPATLRYSISSVGPSIGSEVASRAALAVLAAALGVILYIWFAFRSIPNSFRYGVCAVIAMIHDSLIVISLSCLGQFWGWQFDSLTLTALLTVIGFSVQDKIVVFDRIRENSRIYRKLDFETLVNHSIVQTLERSINTQLMTSEFMLLAMALLGGSSLRDFSIILLVGLLMGTYSSIFIAAPLLVVWQNKEWKNWFGHGNKKAVSEG
ncbi:MAG TPA: protein translocase subunit SecF [Flexilinea sp.]|nr:protein translocase subunit SecF [Flexilinea sp.]HQN62529.1 protein translocase subunit SecF [Flexilinea sp.]